MNDDTINTIKNMTIVFMLKTSLKQKKTNDIMEFNGAKKGTRKKKPCENNEI
jgi:hypothetical protein